MADKERIEAELRQLRGTVKSYNKSNDDAQVGTAKFKKFDQEKADKIWKKIVDESEWKQMFEYQYLHDGKYKISNASNSKINLPGNL